jgi:hypothetical protein
LSILRDCLESLTAQVEPPAWEIIVPYLAGTGDFSKLAADFTGVNFLRVERLASYKPDGVGREHHDELRAFGLRAARGEIVALVEDYARLDPDWSREIVRAHQASYAGIGGAIENAIDRPLNWAVYFCDFGKYQNPLPSGESAYASDANVSYKRSALDAIETTWRDSFHETQVNWELMQQGYRIALDQKIILSQNRVNLNPGTALKERYVWGRSYAVSRIKVVGSLRRALYFITSPLIPFILFLRLTASALSKPNNLSPYLKSFLIAFLLLTSWALGEAVGYASGRA